MSIPIGTGPQRHQVRPAQRPRNLENHDSEQDTEDQDGEVPSPAAHASSRLEVLGAELERAWGFPILPAEMPRGDGAFRTTAHPHMCPCPQTLPTRTILPGAS